jgi:ElaB/YqjD/DUF883 family membrane-anchored ribosome-binding protein
MDHNEVINEVRGKLNEIKAQGKRSIEDEEIRQEIEQIRHNASQFVRKNPIATVAGGFVLGLIVGALISGDD